MTATHRLRLGQSPERGAKNFRRGRELLNYLKGAPDEGIRAAYGVNHERLAALKTRYDVSNFFSSNWNIQPLAPPATSANQSLALNKTEFIRKEATS